MKNPKFCKKLKNKWYNLKVRQQRFHLNGHTIGFRPQTQKLDSHVSIIHVTCLHNWSDRIKVNSTYVSLVCWFFLCTRLLLVCTRMLPVCTRLYSNVACMNLFVLEFVCMYLYVLECCSYVLKCYSFVLECFLYVLVCTSMLLVCTHVLVCCSYVLACTRMLLVCTFLCLL